MSDKLYKVNVFFPFSSLQLPWSTTGDDGVRVPIHLEDPPHDSGEMIGFIPVYGDRDAAERFSSGRWEIDEITRREAQPTPEPQRAYAKLAVAIPEPSSEPAQETTAVTPATTKRRRGRR